MSNKTFIVASREFVENMRTKAFWIGIIAVPILIAASVIVPILLERAKDVRKYVVIDNSGWLLNAVEERAREPNFETVLEKLVSAKIDESGAKKNKHIEELRAKLDSALGAISGETEINQDGLKGLAESLRGNQKLMEESLHKAGAFYRDIGRPEGQAVLAVLPPKIKDTVVTMRQTIIDWWRALPDSDARDYQERSGRGRYERIEADKSLAGDALIEDLNKQILGEKLFAYFVINKDPVRDTVGAKYVSSNLTDDSLRNFFENLATEEVRAKRMASEDIDPKKQEWLLAHYNFDSKKVSKAGGEEKVKDEDQMRQIAPVAFVYLLWIAIFSISQMLLTNTIEEKSNRILEVLLSSISPLDLMLGKIFGIAATGLTMVIAWVISFVTVVHFVPAMLGKESIDLSRIAGDPVFLMSFICYFLAGYLLYASLFVGIGSVCNSVKEASNLMMPVTMILMVPLLAMVPIMKDPNGRLAVFLSYIPPFSPFVMMNRAAGPPTPREYIITSIEIVVCILLVMWGAAKIFRVGVLSTGKAPTFKEVITWMKAPVGHVPTRAEDGEPARK